jgi:spore coat polysaccharide biosynthesis predicted glycosyltransferase SpsG
MRHIVLFADGGISIGTGHIFRLYPIFRCLRTMGVSAEMWVPLEQGLLAKLGLEGVQLASVDPKDVVATLSRSAPAVVILDTYRHRQQLYKLLDKGGHRLVIFDDHFCVDRKVELIVNSSPMVSADNYVTGLARKFLLGPAYTSVSGCFVEARSRYVVSREISSILVALGGSDTCGSLRVLLGTMLPLLQSPMEICVLSAIPISMDTPEHVKLTCVWLDQDSLAQRMLDFDLAILAGGTMLWQTACVGLPTISWPQTPRQKKHAATWESKGAIFIITELDALSDVLTQLRSQHLRLQMSNVGRDLVDGLGAHRIAACLHSMLEG